MRELLDEECQLIGGGLDLKNSVDAAATRQPGQNSWGETTGATDCVAVREITISSVATIGSANCTFSASPPFVSCSSGSSSSQTVTDVTKITCTLP